MFEHASLPLPQLTESDPWPWLNIECTIRPARAVTVRLLAAEKRARPDHPTPLPSTTIFTDLLGLIRAIVRLPDGHALLAATPVDAIAARLAFARSTTFLAFRWLRLLGFLRPLPHHHARYELTLAGCLLLGVGRSTSVTHHNTH